MTFNSKEFCEDANCAKLLQAEASGGVCSWRWRKFYITPFRHV